MEQPTVEAPKTVLPPPGIYRDVPFATYKAWPAVNKSSLDYIQDQSPLHCRYRMDNPEDETPALLIGRAYHTLMLEGAERYAAEFVVAGKCSASKSDKRPCDNPGKFRIGGEWFCGIHMKKDRNARVFEAISGSFLERGFTCRHVSTSGSRYYIHPDGRQARVADHAPNARTARWMFVNAVESIRVDHPPYGNDDPRDIISAETDEMVRGMRAGTLRCSGAREFIGSEGPNELSIIWVDPETGLTCKARIDMARESWNSIGDLKTTEDASRDGFTRSIDKYGYARQGAFYLRGAKAVGIDCEYFSIIPVEKPEPHAAAAYKLLNDAIGAGDEQIGKLLRVYAQCVESGCWPGYSEGFEDISISRWEMRKIADGANA